MPQAVKEVIGEGASKNDLSGVLESLGETRYKLNDVGGGEGLRCDQVGERESVEHYSNEALRL